MARKGIMQQTALLALRGKVYAFKVCMSCRYLWDALGTHCTQGKASNFYLERLGRCSLCMCSHQTLTQSSSSCTVSTAEFSTLRYAHDIMKFHVRTMASKATNNLIRSSKLGRDHFFWVCMPRSLGRPKSPSPEETLGCLAPATICRVLYISECT